MRDKSQSAYLYTISTSFRLCAIAGLKENYKKALRQKWRFINLITKIISRSSGYSAGKLLLPIVSGH